MVPAQCSVAFTVGRDWKIRRLGSIFLAMRGALFDDPVASGKSGAGVGGDAA